MPIVMKPGFGFALGTIGIHLSNCAEIAEIIDAVAIERAYRGWHANFPFLIQFVKLQQPPCQRRF
jgi:hypothetical protein